VQSAGLVNNPLPDGSYPTSLPPGTTGEQYVTYCFTWLLLAANTSGNYMNFESYMPEDYSQSLFRIELGNPSTAYYVVSTSSRDFSKVKVLVNPTSNSYSTNLDANYETLDGTKATTPITVAPHSGLVLKRA
jgi:hypothetical protein